MKNKSIWSEVKQGKTNPRLKDNISVDVLIIGGGMTGISTAYHLSGSSLKVCLVDKNTLCSGVTSRTTGKLTYLQEDIYSKLRKYHNIDKSKLYLESQKDAIKLVRDIIEKENIYCNLEKVKSYVFSTSDNNLSSEINLLKDFGVSLKKTNSLPNGKKVTHAYYVNDTYVFHPLKYLYALKDKCLENDISIYENTIIWGLIIMALGIIFLGNSVNIWNIEIFFKGWWTLFIIIPSLTGLFKSQTVYTSILGLSIGILLLIACQGIITWNMVGKVFLPIVLIVIGFSLVFKKNPKKKLGKNKVPEYTAVFSGCAEKVTEKFKGANCIAIFGGVELDLRNAKITEDIIINCTTIFGGIDLFVPENVNVKSSGTPIFGGIENKTNIKPTTNAPTIYINYVSIFAGIDIK